MKLKAFKTTLENGENFIQELTEIILRMKMKKEGLTLKTDRTAKDLDIMGVGMGMGMGDIEEQY